MTDTQTPDIGDALFPVELRPVYLKVEHGEGMASTQSPAFHRVDSHRAVVDVERNHVFSVVTNSYRLVTNEEAIDLGRECFHQVFSAATADGMELFNIIMPQTRSFCHIDFLHKAAGFDPFPGDRWVAFLRITNSYNRTKLLSFDLGFCRWICKNGMIFGRKSITFRSLHTHGAVASSFQFNTRFGELKALEKQLIERLHNLKRFYVPQEVMLGLICRVLRVEVKPEDLRTLKRMKKLRAFREQVDKLTAKYVNELGPNGYAALNVITDIASRPSLYISPSSMVNELQARSGEWMDEFIAAIKDERFDFAEYLGVFEQSASMLRKAS
jgi:hypothetical protein